MDAHACVSVQCTGCLRPIVPIKSTIYFGKIAFGLQTDADKAIQIQVPHIWKNGLVQGQCSSMGRYLSRFKFSRCITKGGSTGDWVGCNPPISMIFYLNHYYLALKSSLISNFSTKSLLSSPRFSLS